MGKLLGGSIGRCRLLGATSVAGVTALAGCVGLGDSDSSKEDLLAETAFSLVTIEPSDSTEDLQPLADIFADASVIALGEATHGTREFFQVKHGCSSF
jgi:erythromycin esterase